MRNKLMRILGAIALLALPALASAQAVRYGGTITNAMGQAVPGQSIAVCTEPATVTTQPCSPLATLYPDSNGVNYTITSIARGSGVATVTTSGASTVPKGQSVVISGVTDASFDGTFVTLGHSGTNQFSYMQSGSNATSSGGTVSAPNPFQADSLGNYFFYAGTGTYAIMEYGPQIQTSYVQDDVPLGIAVTADQAKAILFGSTSIPASSTPPGSGQCFGYDGTNLLGVGCITSLTGGANISVTGSVPSLTVALSSTPSVSALTLSGTGASGVLQFTGGGTASVSFDKYGNIIANPSSGSGTYFSVTDKSGNRVISVLLDGTDAIHLGSPLGIAYGGTGASTANGALVNLGASGVGSCGASTFVTALTAGAAPSCGSPPGSESAWTYQAGLAMGGACSETTATSCPITVFPSAHTLVRLTVIIYISPSGCTVYPVLGVYDVTSSTTVGSITISSSSSGFVDSGAMSHAMTAGHEFRLGVITADSGCSTVGNFAQLIAIIH